MLHGQQLLINAVLDEEKSDVEMPCPFAGAFLAIGL